MERCVRPAGAELRRDSAFDSPPGAQRQPCSQGGRAAAEVGAAGGKEASRPRQPAGPGRAPRLRWEGGTCLPRGVRVEQRLGLESWGGLRKCTFLKVREPLVSWGRGVAGGCKLFLR